jgi:hypothetical protein
MQLAVGVRSEQVVQQRAPSPLSAHRLQPLGLLLERVELLSIKVLVGQLGHLLRDHVTDRRLFDPREREPFAQQGAVLDEIVRGRRHSRPKTSKFRKKRQVLLGFL